MTSSGDHVPEMSSVPMLDDATIDAIVQGRDVDTGLRDLVEFATEVRGASERPPPRPSPELARLFSHGLTDTLPARHLAGRSPAPRSSRRPRRSLARVAGIGLVAKVCIGATAAAGAAGAAVALPGAPGTAVREAIEDVTPVDFAERDPAGTGAPDRVQPEAHGAPDEREGPGASAADDTTGGGAGGAGSDRVIERSSGGIDPWDDADDHDDPDGDRDAGSPVEGGRPGSADEDDDRDGSRPLELVPQAPHADTSREDAVRGD